MSEIRSHEEMLAQPIASIVDGWDVRGNRLYLFVELEPGHIQTIVIPRRGIQ